MSRRIKSAERTLALFELFARCRRPLTVGEVSRDLRIPQPSASMLLRNLATLGYLDYCRNGRLFSPTVRVMLMGCWSSRQVDSLCTMTHVLERAQRETEADFVYVARQNDVCVQYVWALETDPPNRLSVAPDVPRSLTCTAAGRVLLSLKPDREVIGWIRRSNAEAPADRLKVSERRFLNLRHQCQDLGFAETAGDFVPGLAAMAISIASPTGGSPLAVAFGGAIDRVHRNRVRFLSVLKDVQASLRGEPGPSLEARAGTTEH